MSDHGRPGRELPDDVRIVIGYLSHRLVREHLWMRFRLCDGLGIVRPSGLDRRVACLREDVDTRNPERGPLLIIDGEKDHTVPWAIANASYKR